MIKIVIYFFVLPFVIWILDSIEMNRIFKKNKVQQAQLFYITITLIMSSLLVNFIYDFIEYSVITY